MACRFPRAIEHMWSDLEEEMGGSIDDHTLVVRPSRNEAVTSGNGGLKLLLSHGFLSKHRLPQICEHANHD